MEDLRTEISKNLGNIKQLIAISQPPVVQELVIAQRALEDARMRLGVALAYANDMDPWASQVEAK